MGSVDPLLVLFRREVVKWVKRKPVLLVSLSTPIFWIALFGKSFNLLNLLQTAGLDVDPGIADALRRAMVSVVERVFGTTDYFTYVATGMLAVFALFQSMFGAVGVVFERRIGYLTRLLVAPIPRFSIFFSKVLGTLFRITVLSLILLLVASMMGLKLKQGIGVVDLVMAWIVLMLLSLGLSSVFTGMAFNITNQEVLFALANLVNLPLMFSSSALFPLEQMPSWLKSVAQVNPISHTADLIRYYLIGKSIEPSSQFLYLTVLTVILVFIGYVAALRGMREA
ncbi:MAG: ABC transporter permease [Desulfurococcales archaeon]|nr:ABC transporter permease [Desulfurococcales archaeon]